MPSFMGPASQAVSSTRACFWQRRSRPTEKKRRSLRRSSASQLDECQVRYADDMDNSYRLLKPRFEMTPSHGRTKEGGTVVKSSCPLNSKWPVALAKRPVPPVTSAVSWLPIESAVDFIAVGRKPVKGASVGNIICTKIRIRIAWARGKFRGPGEGA